MEIEKFNSPFVHEPEPKKRMESPLEEVVEITKEYEHLHLDDAITATHKDSKLDSDEEDAEFDAFVDRMADQILNQDKHVDRSFTTHLERYKDKEPLMSKEDWSLYSRQVKESQGFDADLFKGYHDWEEMVLGLIVPVKPPLNEYGEIFKTYVNFAIKRQGKENQIVLEKIVKGNLKVCAPCNFYITFEAKDMEDGGRIKTYQTMVVLQFPDEDTFVHIFREKPSQVC